MFEFIGRLIVWTVALAVLIYAILLGQHKYAKKKGKTSWGNKLDVLIVSLLDRLFGKKSSAK